MNIDYNKINILQSKTAKYQLKIARNHLVEDLALRAEKLQADLKNFKKYCFKQFDKYMNEVSKKYNVTFSTKGNLNITHNELNYRVCKNIQEYIVLDSKLQQAKDLIDKCINKWSEGGSLELKKVVNLAFSVDKRGKLNIPRVLSLRKLDINDVEWQKAMTIISDSIDTENSKQFIRVYKKNKNKKWKSISLDIAKL